MIGTKKLSKIRQEIEQALATPDEDAVERLERQIGSAKRRGDSTEVMEGLKQFLKGPRRSKRGKRRVGAKR